MKKHILIAFLFLGLGVTAQKLPNFPVSYDVSNGDTTLSKYIPQNNAWGLEVRIYNPSDSTGVIGVYVSNDDTLWTLYDAKFTKAISAMDSEVVGSDTVFYCRFADDFWEGNYMGLKFTANTTTIGEIKGILTLKK